MVVLFHLVLEWFVISQVTGIAYFLTCLVLKIWRLRLLGGEATCGLSLSGFLSQWEPQACCLFGMGLWGFKSECKSKRWGIPYWLLRPCFRNQCPVTLNCTHYEQINGWSWLKGRRQAHVSMKGLSKMWQMCFKTAAYCLAGFGFLLTPSLPLLLLDLSQCFLDSQRHFFH